MAEHSKLWEGAGAQAGEQAAGSCHSDLPGEAVPCLNQHSPERSQEQEGAQAPPELSCA